MKQPSDYPRLNLPACRLKVTERGDQTFVWDTVKGQWLQLSPEEWVRRHVITMLTSGGADHLVGEKIIPTNISTEHPIVLNGTHQRADIVVFGADTRPLLLVECKAPTVSLDDTVATQAFRYNTVLGAKYVMLTNGLDHRFQPATNIPT